MANESRDAWRLAQLEEQRKSDAKRIDSLEDRMLLVETKEASRERKANRAVTGVITLGIAIASGIAVALFSGGHP